MESCTYCGLDFSGMSRGRAGNHRRWCRLNPKAIELREKNAEKLSARNTIKYGEYKDFNVRCDICGVEFFVNERELLFNPNKVRHCSRNCANSKGGTIRSLTRELNNEMLYRTKAFKYHKKECIICGEQNIVAVHHFNGNHTDNSIDNLIPLCPTHHQYMHSNFKYIIEHKVILYQEIVKNNLGL